MDSEPEINYEQLASITKFLKVLVEEYPAPINQTEMAKRAGVSKALVSRHRKNIQEFCDLKTMAYEKKYILKEDRKTLENIFLSSLIYEDYSFIQSLIKSIYFDNLISIEEIYQYISLSLIDYYFDEFFSLDDVKWIFTHLKDMIVVYNDDYKDSVMENDEENDMSMLDFMFIIFDARKKEKEDTYVLLIMDKIFNLSSFIININNSLMDINNFHQILEIRNKMYSLIIYNMENNRTYLSELIKDLDIDDEEEYSYAIKGMEIIFKHLIDKIFDNFTESLFNDAENKNIIIDPQYRSIKLIVST